MRGTINESPQLLNVGVFFGRVPTNLVEIIINVFLLFGGSIGSRLLTYLTPCRTVTYVNWEPLVSEE